MRIEDVVRNAQGGHALSNLANAYGVPEAQLGIAFKSISEDLSQRMERNTLSRGGLADLVAALGNPAYAAVLADPALAAGAEARAIGNSGLNLILGSKDASRAVAARAARTSDLDASLVEKLLPVIASMILGGLSQESRNAFHALPEFGGRSSPMDSPLPLPGGGGAFGGTIAPDISASSRGGTFKDQQPLPIPGDRIPGIDRRPNSYDDLSDAIRRGGRRHIPDNGSSPTGGGALSGVVRAIIAAILGFQSRGIVGWVIRLIVVRWGWNFIRRILSRILLGR